LDGADSPEEPSTTRGRPSKNLADANQKLKGVVKPDPQGKKFGKKASFNGKKSSSGGKSDGGKWAVELWKRCGDGMGFGVLADAENLKSSSAWRAIQKRLEDMKRDKWNESAFTHVDVDSVAGRRAVVFQLRMEDIKMHEMATSKAEVSGLHRFKSVQ
jgi:hypothetical protein